MLEQTASDNEQRIFVKKKVLKQVRVIEMSEKSKGISWFIVAC